MAGRVPPSGRGFAEALPMPSAYFAMILRRSELSAATQASLLEGTGVTAASLSASTDITLGQQLRQIRNAARLLDPSWPLHVGTRLSTETHGATGFAIATAPSVGLGIQIMERFSSLRAPHCRVRARRAGDEVRLVLQQVVALSGEERPVLVDLVMLSLQASLEALLGRPIEEARSGELRAGVPALVRALSGQVSRADRSDIGGRGLGVVTAASVLPPTARTKTPVPARVSRRRR